MPDDNPQLERHEKLWEKLNGGQFRWYLAAVLFAVAVSGRLLPTYVGLTRTAETNRVKIAADEQEVVTSLAETDLEQKKLAKAEPIQQFLSEKSWLEHHSALRTAIGTYLDHGRRLKDREEEEPVNPFAESDQDINVAPPITSRGVLNIPAGEDLTDELIDKHVLAAGTRRADRTLQDIVKSFETNVLQPLENMQDDDFGARAAKARKGLTAWHESHRGKRDWWRTVKEKTGTIGVAVNLITPLEDIESVIEKRTNELNLKIDRAQNSLSEAQQNSKQLQSEVADLEGELEDFVPLGLGSLVKIEEMLEFAPLVMMLLISVVALKGRLLRRHYLFLRERSGHSELYFADPSMSSVWTPVWRGTSATVVTLSVYGIGLVIVCMCFWNVCQLNAEWRNVTNNSPSSLIPLVAPFGHLFMAVLAALLVWSVLSDRPRPDQLGD